MNTLMQDVKYALRMMAKSPGFTAIAVLTLALGIGANTAIFSVVDAVLLKPLHFKNPDSLALVWSTLPKRGIASNVTSPPDFYDWQRQNRVFTGMAAFLDQPFNLTGSGEPEQVSVEQVSPNFFDVLEASPMLGRGFSLEEGREGKDNVAVLGYGLWKTRYGGDTQIVGKTIQLNGVATTVIGVLPADFKWYISEFSFTHQPPQLWTPLVLPASTRDRSKTGRFLRAVARLKPGVTLAQAQAQMNVVASGLEARYPQYDKGWGVVVVPLRGQLSGNLRPSLLILLGAVGFVLLIACANISSLLLSRAAGRRREVAIRRALGASRLRIARQMLTESLILGVAGGVTGAFVAMWATAALIRAGSSSTLDIGAVQMDWRVLAFTAGSTLFAGALAGLLPSWISARSEVSSALPEGGRSSSAGLRGVAARNAFVVMEIGLALVLLVGAGLLIQSFSRLTEVDPGFHAAHLLTFQVALPRAKYGTDRARGAFFSDLLERLRHLPGVQFASADVTPPFTGVGSATDFSIVGEPQLPVGESHGTAVRVIEPDYFRTMQVPLLQGRTFNEREFAQESGVVIINQTFADTYFPGKNPIGQKVIIDMKEKNTPSQIVGVAGDVHLSKLSSKPYPTAYWPYAELPYSLMTYVVRTEAAPLSLVPSVRAVVHEIDKDQPIAHVSSMEQLVANSVAGSRFTTLLLTIFAGLALALACIGVYGVMAYSVAQRTHEIGIRMALGAQQKNVLTLVLGQGIRLALAGIALGLVLAYALTRLMASLLFHIAPTDPLTFALAPIVLAGIALLACYIPARRAMRVDPMIALRYE